jgi:hypothetical protein
MSDDDNDDDMDEQLNRSIIKCAIEYYLSQGKYPSVQDIITASRIDEDITDLIEELGYEIDEYDLIHRNSAIGD